MLDLDIRTLAFISVFFSFIYFIGLYLVAVIHRDARGMKCFAYGFLSIGVGFLLLGLRSYVPDWLTIVIANTGIYLGFILMHYGLILFTGSSTQNVKISSALLPLLVAIFIYFTYFDPSIIRRVTTISLFIAISTGLCTLDLLKTGSNNRPLAQLATAISFLVTCVFFLFRSIYTLDAVEIQSFMKASDIHQLALLAVLLHMVSASFEALWMLSSKLEGNLRQQSLTDELTGTYNRRAMVELAANEIAKLKRNPVPLSIIMLDIDHFKQINDQYGHQIGDRVLRRIASILKMTLRREDIVIRYGGEEFLVMLPNTSKKQALVVTEKLQQTLRSTPLNDEFQIRRTASFGIAEMSPEDDWESLVGHADRELLEAKRQGRDCIMVH